METLWRPADLCDEILGLPADGRVVYYSGYLVIDQEDGDNPKRYQIWDIGIVTRELTSAGFTTLATKRTGAYRFDYIAIRTHYLSDYLPLRIVKLIERMRNRYA